MNAWVSGRSINGYHVDLCMGIRQIYKWVSCISMHGYQVDLYKEREREREREITPITEREHAKERKAM